MRKFGFYEYDNVDDYDYIILTEDEIIKSYWEYWTTQMKKVGKEDKINKENCIMDFCTVHWAQEVEDD